MTSLDPATGHDDGFLQLGISGNYQFPGVRATAPGCTTSRSATRGQYDLVMGDFTTAGGLPRQQIFMLDLSTNARIGHGLDVAGVGRQPGRAERVEPRRLPVPVRARRAVLPPGRGMVAGRSEHLHRDHRLSPQRLPDRQLPAHRALRRRGRVPGDHQPGTAAQRPARLRAAQVGELHGLRLALLRRGGRQHRLRRRARALGVQPQRLRRRRPGCGQRPGHGRPLARPTAASSGTRRAAGASAPTT